MRANTARAALDADLLPVRRNKGARTVAVVLDHAEDRQEHAHFGQGGTDRLGVHGTAVDEQGDPGARKSRCLPSR